MDPQEEEHTSVKRFLMPILSVILIVLYIAWTKPHEILRQNTQINFVIIIIALPLSATIYSIMGLRYWLMVRSKSPRYTLQESVCIHFITPIMARITPANMGELLKLNNASLDLDHASFVHLLERIIDFTIIIIFSFGIVMVLGVSDEYTVLITIGIIILVISIIILFKIDYIVNLILRLFSGEHRLDRGWFSRHLKDTERSVSLKFTFLSLLIFILTITVYSFLQSSIGLSIPLTHLAAIIATTVLILSISGLPGGFGIREISLTYILIEYGISQELAVIYTLLITAYMVSNEILFAFLSNLIHTRISKS